MSNRFTLRTILSVIAIAAAGAIPGAAARDPTPSGDSLVLSKIDTNHDGTVSLDEAKAAAAAKLDALDTDREGTLDKSELIGILSPSTITKADKDKDNTLDKAEFLALAEEMFNAADHNHDGTLDAMELSTGQGRALVALLAY